MNDLLHSFPGQEPDEPVFVFARSYFIAFLPTTLVFLFLFAVSLLVEYGLIINVFQTSQVIISYGILFLGFFQLFTLLVFLILLLDYYSTIFLVTDRRLVQIDQEQLFFRRVSELSLEQLEDVTAVTQGFLPTLFNYGSVQVQTSGAEDQFNADNIHMPREVTAITLDLSEQSQKNIPEEQRIPTTDVLAIINNRVIRTVADLQQIGAILPSDLRRPGQK